MRILLAVAGALTAAAVWAQASDPLISRTFDDPEDLKGWNKFGDSDTVELVTRAEHPKDVHTGNGALCYSFKAGEGKFPVLYFEVGDVTEMKCVDLWVKTDMDTALVLALAEHNENFELEGGETYNVVIYTKGGEWTRATVPIQDFRHDDDSPVLNNKLDTDKVSAVALLDVVAVFSAGNKEVAQFLGDHTGRQRILVDDFQVLTKYPGPVSAGAANALDRFDRNYISWVPFLNVDMKLDKMAGTSSGNGLTATYEREAGRLNALVRPVPRELFKGTSRLGFKVSSDKEITLVIGVEESDGGKWNTMLTIAGGGETGSYSISFEDMNPSEDTKDPDGKLSPEKIKLLTFLDATQETGKHTLRIGDIGAR